MQPILLLAGTLIIAVSGLIYELLAGALSSYLLGDSVYQFSIVIGLFMSAMGLGAFVSRYIREGVERAFVLAQIATGILGGGSALLLFYAFVYLDNYSPFLFLLCLGVGTLIGLEIPLVIRILERHLELKLNVSSVLTADYVGALVAALLFPLVLIPQLGLMSSGLVFGLFNLLVAFVGIHLFRDRLAVVPVGAAAAIAALVLGLGLWQSERLVGLFETRLYAQEIIFAETTPYQRVVLTRDGARFQFFINGALQFDSLDEYRYHEALVHPAMSLAQRRAKVLVLGGGDGLVAREVLRYPDVEQIDLVDLDPVITDLFRRNPLLTKLNAGSLGDPRLRVHNDDAWKYVEAYEGFYDVVLIDLPDPHNPGLSKLYSRSFYGQLARRLAVGGVIVTQATSPLFARQAFWCIERTMAQAPARHGSTLYTVPYHAYVPSLGDWGFVLGAHHRVRWQSVAVPPGVKFLTAEVAARMTEFPADMQPVPVEANTLHTHPLLAYYQAGWERWFP